MQLKWMAPILALASLQALADDLSTNWIDRVTHEIQKDEGPLSTKPIELHGYTGIVAAYTDNLFLTDNRRANGDSSLTAFGRGTVDYADARTEVAVDLLVNFDYYMETHAAREDEERFYGKARYADGVIDAQIVQIYRREVDPLDSIFLERARRMISDTIPTFGVEVMEYLKFEVGAQIQVVRFEASDLDSRESETYRAWVGGHYGVTESFALGLEGGVFRINYRNSEITPSAKGWFVRASMRGEPFSRLVMTAAIGYAKARTTKEEPGDEDEEDKDSFDADIHLRWEAGESLVIFLDLIHRYSFAGSGSAFQNVDRGLVIVEWTVVEELSVKFRAQYDRLNPSDAADRTYASVGLGASYRISDHVSADGGVIWKWGDVHEARIRPFDAWIFYIGAAVGF